MYEARFLLPTGGSIQVTDDGETVKVRELNVFTEELWEMDFNAALNLFESVVRCLGVLSFDAAEVEDE